MIGYWKQILNSGPRNEIEGIWSKEDYDDGIRAVYRVGENLNIVLYLVYGNINLRSRAWLTLTPLYIVSRVFVWSQLILNNNP